jgi:4-hydroxy-3-methylbut-2-enyl diphosphate reductase
MEVRMAEHYGMCFGVKDAIDLALRLTRQGPLTILGDLVHNPDVVQQMEVAGAVRANQIETVETRAVLLTAAPRRRSSWNSASRAIKSTMPPARWSSASTWPSTG